MSRRILRIAVVAAVAVAFTACSNPLAPSGKLPTTPRPDLITPNGDLITPNGDLITPNGNLITPNGNLITPNG
ncbi:MAG: hypothetical protein AB1762_17895 [Gemmatimonadota bacterium]